ncbi:retrovirus-related pol polyprotein from transposon TNT 1-94 [Tanacetum coccineum]
METLSDKAILSGADNRPPMLEKDMYHSWKSRMEFYMQNRQHGRMILESVEKGHLVWPTIEVDGVVRARKYAELVPADQIQTDSDMKAINIILQRLPTEIYALVSHHKVTKELWERIQLLMQGTSLTKQEREINIEQFHINIKFLNSLPSKWSKFIIDVKLVKDLHITNVDKLHAYLKQHEKHANEVRLMLERSHDPLALVAYHQMTQTFTASASGSNAGKQRTVICYNYRREGHMAKQCTQPKRKRDATWFKDTVLLVEAQANGHLLYEEELAFLVDPSIAEGQNGSDVLHKGMNIPTQREETILYVIEQMSAKVLECNKEIQDNKSVNDTLSVELVRYKEKVKIFEESQNDDPNKCEKVTYSQFDELIRDKHAQIAKIESLKQTLSEELKEKEFLEKSVNGFKTDFKTIE